MQQEEIARITRRYASGSAWDRFHVKHRLRFLPHELLLPFLPTSGSVLDIGCGFGLFGWFLAEHRPGLDYYGADIDARKLELGQRSFADHYAGPRAMQLHAGDVRDWRERPAQFKTVALLDVLLLLPMQLQRELFEFACQSLEKSDDAVILLKIQPWLRGMAHLRTFIQETIMVRVLRKTKTSGALFLRQDPALYEGWARELGFECERVDVPAYPPSLLLVLRRRS